MLNRRKRLSNESWQAVISLFHIAAVFSKYLAAHQNPSYFMSHARCESILLIYFKVYHNFWQTAEPEHEPEPFEKENS